MYSRLNIDFDSQLGLLGLRFSLILFEIISRRNPFDEFDLSVSDILNCIINPQMNYHRIFRPNVEHLKCALYISKCVSADGVFDHDASR